MTAPFEYIEDTDEQQANPQPDVLRLLPDGNLPVSVIDSMQGGGQCSASDFQLTGQPRMASGMGQSSGNPFYGPWLSPVSRGLGGGLALAQRFATYGPMGGNPWQSWPTHVPARLLGRGGGSQMASPYTLLNGSPYAQFNSNQNNPLNQAIAALYLYNLLQNGGSGSGYGGNPWGGGYPPYNPLGGNPLNQRNNPLSQIAGALYLYNLIQNGSGGSGFGGNPWGGGYPPYNPLGGNPLNQRNNPLSQIGTALYLYNLLQNGGNSFGGTGAYPPYGGNLFNQRNNPMSQIANSMYLYNHLQNGGGSGYGGNPWGGGYGSGGSNMLNSLPYLLNSIGNLGSLGRGRLRL